MAKRSTAFAETLHARRTDQVVVWLIGLFFDGLDSSENVLYSEGITTTTVDS
jgi:hypothetical protein